MECNQDRDNHGCDSNPDFYYDSMEYDKDDRDHGGKWDKDSSFRCLYCDVDRHHDNHRKYCYNNFITGLAQSAVKWGTDIIDGIVNGIKKCIGKVKDAVSNVAETIKSYLHFSVPDAGPLTDYESWMPDFMGGLADGIEKSRGLVTKEIKKLTDTMNLENMMPDMDASLNATVGGNVSSGENGTVKLNQPIMLDGRVITTLVSQIQYSNGQASMRNLGIS